MQHCPRVAPRGTAQTADQAQPPAAGPPHQQEAPSTAQLLLGPFLWATLQGACLRDHWRPHHLCHPAEPPLLPPPSPSQLEPSHVLRCLGSHPLELAMQSGWQPPACLPMQWTTWWWLRTWPAMRSATSHTSRSLSLPWQFPLMQRQADSMVQNCELLFKLARVMLLTVHVPMLFKGCVF